MSCPTPHPERSYVEHCARRKRDRRRQMVDLWPTDRVVSRPVGAAVVLGEFDGVHRGNVELIAVARRHAEALNAAVVAVVADVGQQAPHIMSVTRRCELLLSQGVSSAFVAPIRHPDQVEGTLGSTLEQLRPLSMFVDNESWPSLPRHRLYSYLRGIGADVHEVRAHRDPVLGRIKAQAIMDRIRAGDVQTTSAMLGRPYELSGIVVRRSQGRLSTSFASEYLRPEPGIVFPRTGVYAARAQVGRRWIGAAVDIGMRPTFDSSGSVVVEAHLIGLDGDLLDTELSLRFVERLRDERQFSGPTELAEQIGRDITGVSTLLSAFG